MKRSSHYRFTANSPTDPRIVEFRKYISSINAARSAENCRRLVVKVRPRLGRNNPHAHLYAVGGPLKRYSSQNIRKEHGTRFDVYLYEEINWTKWLARKAADEAALRAKIFEDVPAKKLIKMPAKMPGQMLGQMPAAKKPTLVVDPAF